MLTWDDVYGRLGVPSQNTPQPVDNTGRVDTFAQIYGPGGSNPIQNTPAPSTPTAQDLPPGWWSNPFYSNVPGWGKSPGDQNAANWNPNQYTDSASRAAAWNALGQPSVDYMGRSVTGQDGGGVIAWGGKQIAPNTNDGFSQVLQSQNMFKPTSPNSTANSTANSTTNSTPSYGASAPPASNGEVSGLPTTTNTATTPTAGSTTNRTNNQTVLGGQLNADLTVSNPRRRVANAMVMRR